MKKYLFLLFFFPLFLGHSHAASPFPPQGYRIPQETLSPTKRYGFLVPFFTVPPLPNPKNALVDLKRKKILTYVKAPTAFAQPLNYTSFVSPRWTQDESSVLWEVTGKWAPAAIVLMKLQEGASPKQCDLLAAFQQQILAATKKQPLKNITPLKKRMLVMELPIPMALLLPWR